MKKFLYPFAGISLLCLASTSCQESTENHADKVLLSKANSECYVPAIDGSLGQYYGVVPADSVVLNLADSVLGFDVTLKLNTPYKADKFTRATIVNEDSLRSKYPYIVLTDSAGRAFNNIIFEMDTTSLSQLNKLMSGKTDEQLTIHFSAVNNLDQQAWDSIAPLAVNYKVMANIREDVDTSSFDKLLNNFQAAINNLKEVNRGFGPMGPTTTLMMSLYTPTKNRYDAARVAAKAQYDKMSDTQKARFDKLQAIRVK